MLISFNLPKQSQIFLFLIIVDLMEVILGFEGLDFDSDYEIINEIPNIFFIIFYFLERKLSNTNNHFMSYAKFISIQEKKEPIKKIYILLLLILITIILNYLHIYLCKISPSIGIGFFFKMIFCYCTEKIFEKKNFYIHHKISFFLNCIFGLIFLIATETINFDSLINFGFFVYFFFDTYVYTLSLFTIKYINTYFYISIYLLLFIFGMSNLIFKIIFLQVNDKILKQQLSLELDYKNILLIIQKFIYLSLFYNILLFKGTIYAITIMCISLVIKNLYILIIDLLNNEYSKSNLLEIIILITSIIPSLIYLEIIQFNFYGLNDDTRISIEERGLIEQSNSNIIDDSFSEGIKVSN